jgi:hypothetical protein
MAKEKNRGNRETKKPKKPKPAVAIATSTFGDRKPAGQPKAPKKS